MTDLENYGTAQSLLNSVAGLKDQISAPPGAVDFASIRDDGLDTLDDLEDLHFPEALEALITQCVPLPRADIQVPLAAAYLALPSALCSRVPILYSHGPSGCGKSALGKIACLLHRRKPIGAGSTMASIRNDIRTGRFFDPEAGDKQKFNEKHWKLIWEDIDASTLSGYDGKTLALFKNGIERTGTITMAGEKGTNIEFSVFCPKMISSIHALYAVPQFRELVRRVLVIQHKPIDLWRPEESSSNYPIPDELLDLDGYALDYMPVKFEEFWSSPGNLAEWTSAIRSLRRKRPNSISQNNWKMSLDLLVCGVVCGYWNKDDGISLIAQYWNWHSENIASQSGAVVTILRVLIGEQTAGLEEKNQKFIEQGLDFAVQPLEIEPKIITTRLKQAASEGELDQRATPQVVKDAMSLLGWQLCQKDGSSKMVYRPLA